MVEMVDQLHHIQQEEAVVLLLRVLMVLIQLLVQVVREQQLQFQDHQQLTLEAVEAEEDLFLHIHLLKEMVELVVAVQVGVELVVPQQLQEYQERLILVVGVEQEIHQVLEVFLQDL